MNVKEIDPRYRLLHLIYEGRTSGILNDINLRSSLNDLMKYELVTINNNKLSLTERGINALKNGVNNVITRVKSKQNETAGKVQVIDHLTILIVTISVLLLVILLFMTL